MITPEVLCYSRAVAKRTGNVEIFPVDRPEREQGRR